MDAADRVPHGVVRELEYRVLLKLANVAAQDGTRAWRNMHEVAVELGVSLRSVQRAIKTLETERLITRGEQRHVDHMRGDRRPIVYDLNLEKMLNWDAYHGLELVELHGATELFTPLVQFDHGATNGATTVVAHKELIELPNKTKKFSHHSAREAKPVDKGTCGHRMVTDRYYEMGCKPSRELVDA